MAGNLRTGSKPPYPVRPAVWRLIHGRFPATRLLVCCCRPQADSKETAMNQQETVSRASITSCYFKSPFKQKKSQIGPGSRVRIPPTGQNPPEFISPGNLFRTEPPEPESSGNTGLLRHGSSTCSKLHGNFS